MSDDANFVVKFVYGKPGEEFPVKKINVSTGRQGLQGPKGDPGSFENVIKTAAVDIPGHRFVSLNMDNKIEPTNLLEPYSRYSILGFIESAVDAGQQTQVKTMGYTSDTSFSLIPEYPVFIAANGLFTCIEPESGWVSQVGTVINANSFFINIDKTYYKE